MIIGKVKGGSGQRCVTASRRWDYYEEVFAQADQLLECEAMAGMPAEIAAVLRPGEVMVVRFDFGE